MFVKIINVDIKISYYNVKKFTKILYYYTDKRKNS